MKKLKILVFLIPLTVYTIALGQQLAQSSPDEAIAWSEAIGQIFDAWWERVLLIISLLGNLGLVTKSGRQGLKQVATAGKSKPNA